MRGGISLLFAFLPQGGGGTHFNRGVTGNAGVWVMGLWECNWWTCVRRNRPGEKRDTLIISHWHLPPENISIRTKTNMYACIYGELHWHTLSAQFGFSLQSRCGEWPLSRMRVKHNKHGQSVHRSCEVALAPGTNWTIGVLRADQGAIDDYARPRFYKVDWLPRFAVISISVHVRAVVHSNQSVRVGEMSRSLNGRLKTVFISPSICFWSRFLSISLKKKLPLEVGGGGGAGLRVTGYSPGFTFLKLSQSPVKRAHRTVST